MSGTDRTVAAIRHERAEGDGHSIRPIAFGVFIGAAARDGFDDVMVADWLARASTHRSSDVVTHADEGPPYGELVVGAAGHLLNVVSKFSADIGPTSCPAAAASAKRWSSTRIMPIARKRWARIASSPSTSSPAGESHKWNTRRVFNSWSRRWDRPRTQGVDGDIDVRGLSGPGGGPIDQRSTQILVPRRRSASATRAIASSSTMPAARSASIVT